MFLKKIIGMTLAMSFLCSFLLVAAPSYAVPVDPATVKQRKITIHRSLLNIYKAQSRKDDALREFPIMLALTPQDAKLRHEYGIFLARSGNKKGAVAQLKKAASMDPSNPDIAGALGTTLIQLKNYPEGCKYLRQAVSTGGKKYKKMYDDAYKYMQYQRQREIYNKKQAEYKKKLEARKKLLEKRARGEEADDDDW